MSCVCAMPVGLIPSGQLNLSALRPISITMIELSEAIDIVEHTSSFKYVAMTRERLAVAWSLY